jgi:hypothetical protein
MAKKTAKQPIRPPAAEAAVKPPVTIKPADPLKPTAPVAVAKPLPGPITPPAPKPAAPSPMPPKPLAPAPATASPKPAALGKPAASVSVGQVMTAFTLEAPEAKQVLLGGDFNNWNPDRTPLRRKEGGRWEAAVPLRPGRYQYKFVADGQWLHDPKALENVPNEHGSLNSVREVRA